MGQKSMETRGKSAFFRSAFLGISSVFSLIYLVFLPQKYSTCDTCDSKKSTSLLEGARTTRTHEKTKWGVFCKIKITILVYRQNKMSLFRDFFPL